MTSYYDDIFSVFLSKITDFNLINMSSADSKNLMTEWLKSVIGNPYIKRIFSSISLDDDLEEITYTLKFSVNEEQDDFFIKEVFSKGMVIKWLEPQVNSTLNIGQIYSGKEQKFYSQANHLDSINSLHENLKTELRKMIRDYCSINNSYLED